VLIIARSILFAGLFHLNLAVHLIAALPTLAMRRRHLLTIAKSWSRANAWLLRAVCDIKVEWAGLDGIPPGPLIVASKHQSTWEIFALLGVFADPAFIIKREAMQIPLLGWCMRKAGMIAVGRGDRSAQRTATTERARHELGRGRQLIIFPEGTRRRPGAEPVYRDVVAHLYAETGTPCLPVALNSGLVWRLRSLVRRPGTIRVEFLGVIAPGLSGQVLLERLQSEIETATARLIAGRDQEEPTD
jgi:1-acyl-sn-glycerol-3-phosphate acyltransferase